MLDEAGRLDWRLMDTRKDSTDFSDRIRVLDQGEEGACTGFGRAATTNYLNLGRHADATVSPRMLWETGLDASVKDIFLRKDNVADDRAGGIGDWKDRVIEKVTRKPGHAIWKEIMDEAALGYATPGNAGSRTLKYLHDAMTAVTKSKRPRLHMIGHSAGSI